MKIQLKRKLRVRRTEALATIACPVERPMECAVVKWVEEQTTRGAAATLEGLRAKSGGLLPGRSALLAQRLAQVCEDLGVVRLRGDALEVTDEGRKALQMRRILVSEERLWEVWWTDDPLIEGRVLLLRGLQTGSATDAWNEMKNAKKKVIRPVDPLPDALSKIKGERVLPFGVVHVARFDEWQRTAQTNEAKADVSVTWTLTQDNDSRIELDGTIQDERFRGGLAGPQYAWDSAREQVLRARTHPSWWDAERLTLHLPFEVISEPGRERMIETLGVRAVPIDRYKTFETATMADVPLAPLEKADAEAWFAWLLDRSINDFVGAEEFASLVREARSRFAGWDLSTPSRSDYAASARGSESEPPPKKWWFLRAPADLDGLVTP